MVNLVRQDRSEHFKSVGSVAYAGEVQSVSDLYNMGLEKYKAKDLSGAEQVFRQCIQMDKNYEYAYSMLGEVLMQTNLSNEAIKYLEVAVNLKADFLNYFKLGKAYLFSGNKTKALENLVKAKELGSKDSRVKSNQMKIFDQYIDQARQ